jgi:hypothetical protein
MAITTGGEAFLRDARINDYESIALRVFQYGFAHAVQTRQTAGSVTALSMSAARIIRRRTPDQDAAHLGFSDKTMRGYDADALKALDRSFDALDRQDMALLFPFRLLKFRREADKELWERQRTHWQDYLQEGGRRCMQLGEKRAIDLLEQGSALEQIKRTLAP